jgi:hypothetical protein
MGRLVTSAATGSKWVRLVTVAATGRGDGTFVERLGLLGVGGRLDNRGCGI